MSKCARNGGSHVYVAGCTVTACVKVGVTGNIASRVESLGCARGAPVEMLHVSERTVSAFKVEKRAHQILSEYALGGEWFDVCASTAIKAVAKAEEDVAQGWRWPRMACHDARKGRALPPKDWPDRWRGK